MQRIRRMILLDDIEEEIYLLLEGKYIPVGNYDEWEYIRNQAAIELANTRNSKECFRNYYSKICNLIRKRNFGSPAE